MADWKSLFFRLVNLARAEKLITDEGDIVGWATNESGEHYPIHAPTGGGGSSSGGKSVRGSGSSYKEKMMERAQKHREQAEKAQAEAERRWNQQGEMARETPMGQPVISQSYGNYRKSMQNEFEKGREAHNKAEYHRQKAENIEKRFAPVDVGKVRAEIAQKESWKAALSKAERAIKAGNREEAIAEMEKVNPRLRPLLEKQTPGTLKQMISGTKRTNAQELKSLKAKEAKARGEA